MRLCKFRTCLHKKCVRIFEHNFVADKARIRRRAFARQGFLTQSAAKFAEKTCAYACEDGFSHIKSKISAKITAYIFFIKDNTITANPKKQKANRNLLSR